MQIKSTMRYHFTPIRMITIKQQQQQVFMKMWRNWNGGARLVGMQNVAATMKNSMEVPQSIKDRTTTWSCNSTSRYTHIYRRVESRISKRYLYTHVHCSIIHDSQELEEAQISMDRWMNKETVVYTYNAILFSLEKERNTVTCYNIIEIWRRYSELNEPVTKGLLPYDSTIWDT